MTKTECKSCMGTGQNMDDDALCDQCSGKGFIEPEQAATSQNPMRCAQIEIQDCLGQLENIYNRLQYLRGLKQLPENLDDEIRRANRDIENVKDDLDFIIKEIEKKLVQ
jgi:hypothetical protein